MSIEYYVEGKITTQTEGDQRTFSKGDIEHNSIKNVNQQGTETGVSLNSPDQIHGNDIPINIIEVSLNLFFDGTQNNKTNTDLGKDYDKSNHEDDSYTNAYSNIARAYNAINPTEGNQVSWYIEGIGTEDKKSETIPIIGTPNAAILFGTGSRGVKAKVTKGCIEGAFQLSQYANQDIHLKVNVFGFSRGAAAARYFLHIATSGTERKPGLDPAINALFNTEFEEIIAPYNLKGSELTVERNHPLILNHGYFGACLMQNNVIPKKIIFNFAGLYDTVASYGVVHREKKIGKIVYIKGDTDNLKLNSVSKCAFVLQIASDNEYRDNFDLTNIDSAAINGLQITLPGVHSDIGGCYVNENPEIVDIYTEIGNRGAKCEEYKKILLEEGWFVDDGKELVIEKRFPSVPSLHPEYVLVGSRTPYNSYDKIPLKIMFHYSKLEQFGVKYKCSAENDNNITDKFLIEAYRQLLGYVNECNDLRNSCAKISADRGFYLDKLKRLNHQNYIENLYLQILRNRYLHWSASATKFGYGPRIGMVTKDKKRKRIIQQG